MPIDASIPLSYKQPDILDTMGKITALKKAQTDAEAARFKLTSDQRDKMVGLAAQLKNHPAFLNGDVQGMQDAITALHQDTQEAGIPEQKAAVFLSNLHGRIAADPKNAISNLNNLLYGTQPTSTQYAQLQGASTPGGVTPSGQAYENVVSPIGGVTQQIIQQTPGQGIKPPLQVAPSLGQPQAVAGRLDTVNKDFADTQSQASIAQRNIGILQNIKALAPKAILGTSSDKLVFVDGILAQMGIPSTGDLKTDTDLFHKNSAMLGGGASDIARLTTEAANPNSKMTPQAAIEAANQRIGQEKLPLVKQRTLLPHYNNAQFDQGAGYTRALADFNANADPRILQLSEMNPDERRKFIQSMPVADRKSFINKVSTFEKNGWMQ